MTTMTTDLRDEREEAPERLIVCTDTSTGKPAIADWLKEHMKPCDVEYVRADLAATRMRDLCVEKVREMRDGWEAERANENNRQSYRESAASWVWAADQIITALESLTLDQVEQKQ